MVDRVDFAVSAGIADKVNDLKEHYPELNSMHILTINNIDAHSAAGIVGDGLSHVGPDELGHLFDELLGGVLTAGALHTAVNGFLLYKGSKEFSDAFAATAASTTIRGAGIGVGLFADMLWHTAMVSGAIGIGGRVLLGRLARSRWSFAELLDASIAAFNAHIASLTRPAIA